MNILINQLRNACKDRLLDEKWVLSSSLRAGHEWLMAVARSGQPVVNAHVKTIAKLALDLAGPLVAEKELDVRRSATGLTSCRSHHAAVEQAGGRVSAAS